MKHEHDILTYIKSNPVMVIGTIDSRGLPYSAAVYVYAASASEVYFVTKTETQKFRNIRNNPHVSVTIVDPTENSTLQAQGKASAIQDMQTIEDVMSEMARIYARSADWLPPIAKIRAGSYQVIRITLHGVRLAQYRFAHAGSPHIFKELE